MKWKGLCIKNQGSKKGSRFWGRQEWFKGKKTNQPKTTRQQTPNPLESSGVGRTGGGLNANLGLKKTRWERRGKTWRERCSLG